MLSKQARQLFAQIGESSCHLCSDFINFCGFIGELSVALCDAIRHPRKVKWSQTAYYMDVCGSDAVPIISLLGLLIGVILAFQAIVQLGRFGVESYVVNLVGTVIVTELGPLVTAIVLAGRSGSAFAAEIGSMKASEEIDAMITMGFDTNRYLIIPKVLALLVITPCLTIFSNVCGIIGGLIVVCADLDFTVAEYYYKTIEVIQPIDLFQGLFKSLFFAVIVSAIGCMKGFEADKDAQGVGKAATSAVVSAIFQIVIADAILTALFSM